MMNRLDTIATTGKPTYSIDEIEIEMEDREAPKADDTKPLPTVKVSLIIRGFSGDPDDITGILGIRPSRTARKGDVVERPHAKITVKASQWVLEAPGFGRTSLQSQLEGLLESATPNAREFGRLPEGCMLTIFCGVTDYFRSVDLSISASIVKQVALIGADVAIDYYDLTDWDKYAST